MRQKENQESSVLEVKERVLQAGRSQSEWLTGINAAENASELRTKVFLWI